MSPQPLKLLVLGAHPDDAEFHAGGLAALYRREGHQVRFVSVTNGEAGHHESSGPELARRRRLEAAAAAEVIGAESAVWSYADGRLEPTLAARWQVIGELRRFRPDLVLTHRPVDYHPDHRAVGQLVQDASYLVTVPAILSELPILERPPVVAYMSDRFTRPYPLAADVVLDVGMQIETMVRMLACHRSQVFEWLPMNRGLAGEVPEDGPSRMTWLRSWYEAWLRPMADLYREALVATYGSERGRAVQFAEVHEISQYAAPLDEAARRRLFPPFDRE